MNVRVQLQQMGTRRGHGIPQRRVRQLHAYRAEDARTDIKVLGLANRRLYPGVRTLRKSTARSVQDLLVGRGAFVRGLDAIVVT